MRWFRRKRKETASQLSPHDQAHLAQFVASRRGVEAYIEPATSVTAITVVLIAHDGEWTRRRIGSDAAARALAHQLGIPIYDATIVGYPARMREWTSRQRTTQRD